MPHPMLVCNSGDDHTTGKVTATSGHVAADKQSTDVDSFILRTVLLFRFSASHVSTCVLISATVSEGQQQGAAAGWG